MANRTGTRYKPSFETDSEIIKLLALEKEFAQYDMPKRVGKNYRTILRHLKDLKKKGLIALSRTEESKKAGKRKNIWVVTFYGLMEILKLLDDKEIDQVAQEYSDKWLVFAEWQFLLRIYEGTLYRIVRSISCQFNSLETIAKTPFTDSEIKQMGYTREEWLKKQGALEKFVLEKTKQDCTDPILGLDILTDKRKLKFLWEKLGERWLHIRSKTLASFAENPKIKQYVETRFEQEEVAHNIVESLRGKWKKLKT